MCCWLKLPSTSILETVMSRALSRSPAVFVSRVSRRPSSSTGLSLPDCETRFSARSPTCATFPTPGRGFGTDAAVVDDRQKSTSSGAPSRGGRTNAATPRRSLTARWNPSTLTAAPRWMAEKTTASRACRMPQPRRAGCAPDRRRHTCCGPTPSTARGATPLSLRTVAADPSGDS